MKYFWFYLIKQEKKDNNDDDEVLYEENAVTLQELEEELDKIKNYNREQNIENQDDKGSKKNTDVMENKKEDSKEGAIKGDEVSKLNTEQGQRTRMRVTEGELPVTMTDDQSEKNTVMEDRYEESLLPNYDRKLYK
jgi:DNA-nicking Smr family endonuclease